MKTSAISRGDLLTIATQGDFGKPRPALVIQANQFEGLGSVTVLLLTSELNDAPLLRIAIHPSKANGLEKPSQVMIDKTMTVRRDKLGEVFGCLNPSEMTHIERNLAVFLGIAS